MSRIEQKRVTGSTISTFFLLISGLEYMVENLYLVSLMKLSRTDIRITYF